MTSEKTLRKALKRAETSYQEAKLDYDKASGARLAAQKALENYVDPYTGLRIKTKEILFKEFLDLEWRGSGWSLIKNNGPEPCGARDYDVVIHNLLQSEVDYIVNNWKECKVWIREYEDTNFRNR